ncbi:hypothetical protein GC163_07585 [bacterium]|nr:hypothetical protein [bacterium]
MSSSTLFGEDDPWARQRTSGVEVDMTSMIDCTFLLLIFFMVCSTMQSQPDIDLPVAAHSIGVDTQGASLITILAGAFNEPPRILLGDGVGDEVALDEVRRFVSDAVAAGNSRIVVKAEGDVSHGFIEDVARQIVAVEGAQLYMGVGDTPEDSQP